MAILGERFDLRTAMAASERDPDGCLDALDAAIVTRILVPDGDGYRFAHALVRDAVLAQLTPLRRARLHHRAAEALQATWGQGPDLAEPIAYHRLAAIKVADPLLAARAAIRASDVARWRGALDAADELADHALEALAGVARTSEVEDVEVEALEAIAAAAYRRESPDVRENLGARVLALAERTGNDSARALGLFLTWDEIDDVDDLRKIRNDPARELAARATDRYAIVTTRYMLASYALLIGELDEADREIEVAITAAGPTDPDERPQHVPLVLVPVVAGIVAAVRGEADVARVHTQRRAPAWLAERLEVDPTAQVALAFNRALVEALLGSATGVLAELDSIDLSDRWGFVSQQAATCEVLAGWARACLGDADGVDLAFAGLAVIEEGKELVLRATLKTFVGQALLEVGDSRAVEVLAEARPRGRGPSRGLVVVGDDSPPGARRPAFRRRLAGGGVARRGRAVGDPPGRAGDPAPHRRQPLTLPARPASSPQAADKRPPASWGSSTRQIPTTEENHHEHPLPPQQPQPHVRAAPHLDLRRHHSPAELEPVQPRPRRLPAPLPERADHLIRETQPRGGKIDGDGHRSTPDQAHPTTGPRDDRARRGAGRGLFRRLRLRGDHA